MKIELNKYGDELSPYPQRDGIDADDLLDFCIHKGCCGFVDLNRISEQWQSLDCRRCNLRVMIPAHIKRMGALQEWLREREGI